MVWVYTTNTVLAEYQTELNAGNFEQASNALYELYQDPDLIGYNEGHVRFRSGANAVGSSEWFLDRIRVMSGGVYMVDELSQLDDGNDAVIQSRERAVVYFSGSTYSGASHNAEVIRELLGMESEDDTEQDTEQSDDESNEESDESDEEQEGESDGEGEGEGEESDQDENEGESDQQQQDENGDSEWDEWEWEWQPDEQQPQQAQLPQQVKEQLQDYQEQLEQQQAQNQQYFNKQQPEVSQQQDLFEALFGQPQLRQELGGGGNKKDW